ncbi:MAG: glucose-1-phosphate cytidylyltransferase [Chthoniobacteraceae bacterium]
MKVVILCGGLGTRLREETEFRPKPMVPIGGRPILWHIMKTYASHGHKEFILCLGYKGEVIKEYFRNYHWNISDVTLTLGPVPKIKYHGSHDEEDWTVTLVDTGQETLTGGRIKRVLPYVGEGDFLLSYGDGLTDSNINASIDFHKKHGALATVTAITPESRFGELSLDGDTVTSFREKQADEVSLINGGYFVLNSRISEYIPDKECYFEQEPLRGLSSQHQLKAWVHCGFWQCMDTFREQQILEQMWQSGRAPWKIW